MDIGMDVEDPATDTTGHEQADGHLLSWGCGEFGQHGHGGNGADLGPEQALVSQVQELLGSHRIKLVACGASHTAVVTDEDEILTWGNGNSGQLGCGDKVTHTSPQILRIGPHDSSVAGVVCGSRHTVVWLESGRAYSCGNNFYAQLGYDFRIKNYKENQVLPHLLRPIMHKKVTQVACGEKFTLFLFDTGQVAGCGANNFGQLGNGTRAEMVSPKPLEDPENIVNIACGSCHSLAVTASGELYVWGMGRPCGSRRDDLLTPQRRMTRQSNVVGVAGGSAHSLALTANGTVYSWGGGADGQLGHGEDVMYLSQPRALSTGVLPGPAVQVACGDSYSAALLGDGALYMWGKSSHVITADQPSSSKVFQPTRIPLNDGSPIAMVTCGSWHVAALTGTPVRQPLDEDSENSEPPSDEDMAEVMDTMLDKELDARLGEQSTKTEDFLELSDKVGPPIDGDQSVHQPSYEPSPPPMRLAREGTKLTLEEFYSPSPRPRVRPQDLRPGPRKKAAVLHSETVNEDKSETEKDMDDILPHASEDVDEMKHKHLSVKEMLNNQSFSKELEEKNSSAKESLVPDSPSQNTKHHPIKVEPSRKLYMPPPKTSYLSRSRTMDSIPKKMSPSKGVPRVYDMSAMSGGGDASGDLQGKFVIDKHMSIQARKASASSSPTSSAASSKGQGSPKQVVAMVSLMSGSSEELPEMKDVKATNSMPAPKLTRAHTLYGQMGSRGKIERAKAAGFSPPVIHAAAPLATMVYKTAPSKPPLRNKQTPNSLSRTKGMVGSTSTKGGSSMKALGNLQRTGSSSSITDPSQRRPVFSSAASWRQRSEADDVLIGDGKPPTSIRERRASGKDV